MILDLRPRHRMVESEHRLENYNSRKALKFASDCRPKIQRRLSLHCSLKMDSALNNIKQLAAEADEATRLELKTSLNKLALSLERPDDTIHRFGHMVGFHTCSVKFHGI